MPSLRRACPLRRFRCQGCQGSLPASAPAGRWPLRASARRSVPVPALSARVHPVSQPKTRTRAPRLHAKQKKTIRALGGSREICGGFGFTLSFPSARKSFDSGRRSDEIRREIKKKSRKDLQFLHLLPSSPLQNRRSFEVGALLPPSICVWGFDDFVFSNFSFFPFFSPQLPVRKKVAAPRQRIRPFDLSSAIYTEI